MSIFDDLTVLILAGGQGTRLKGMFPNVPKPLIPVARRPFLYWLTRWIARHGPRHFVYSTGYLADQIEAWTQDRSLIGLIRECRSEPEPLGTGGAIVNALDLCREWVLVANGDSLVMHGISDLLQLRSRDEDGGLIGIKAKNSARYGSLDISINGLLEGFREKISGCGIINSGLYLFRTDLLRRHLLVGPQSLEIDVFPKLIEQGAKLRVLSFSNAPFIDIGTPETLREAECFIATHFSQE